MSELRDALYVDGVRLPIGRAKKTGYYANTRADDMSVRVIRALLERNPGLDPEVIEDVAWAATAQVGDQGLTLGRSLAVLAGLPTSVPGYAIDRMCAGAMTAIVNGANAIRVGGQKAVIAGGVEHMGNHPMGAEVDPNPRFLVDKLVDPSALIMGNTAENLHDEHPDITRDRTDEFGVLSQERTAKAKANGVFDDHVVPMTVFSEEHGWRKVAEDEHPRPGVTAEDLGKLNSPFRVGGSVTAGNAAGLNDGAGGVLLASREVVEEQGLKARMRMVDFAYAGVPAETMGYGPVPATDKLLEKNSLSIDDIDVIDINEAFAVQVVAFLDHYGLPLDSDKVNPYGGAISLGHPLAMSGARLCMQVASYFERNPDARYGIATMCVGLGMGASVLWENVSA